MKTAWLDDLITVAKFWHIKLCAVFLEHPVFLRAWYQRAWTMLLIMNYCNIWRISVLDLWTRRQTRINMLTDSHRVINVWNSLLECIVSAPSNAFTISWISLDCLNVINFSRKNCIVFCFMFPSQCWNTVLCRCFETVVFLLVLLGWIK